MNYYKALGVASYASPEEIKKAYYSLMKQYHPDNYKGDSKIAQAMIRELNEAYDTLSNPDKKLIYDYDLRHNARESTESSSKQRDDANNTMNKESTYNKSTASQKKKSTEQTKPKREEKKFRFPDITGCLGSIIGYGILALIIFKVLGGQIDTHGIWQWGKEFASKQVHQLSRLTDKDKSIDNIENFDTESPSYVLARFMNAMKERMQDNDESVKEYVSIDFGKEFEAAYDFDDLYLDYICILNDEYISYYRDDYASKCSDFGVWIIGEEINDDKAILKVEIDTANYARSVEKAYIDLTIEDAKIMKKNLYGVPDSDRPNVFINKLHKAVRRYDKTFIVKLSFTLEKEDGVWIITECSDNKRFINALLANGLSSIETGEFDYLLLKYLQ